MTARPLRVGVDGRVLANPPMRGWTRYAGNLLRALAARDDVELVVFVREPPCPQHLAGVRGRVVRFDASREALWNDWHLPRQLRAARIDVFHALADRGLPLVKPCPLVVTLHNSYERAHWRALFPTVKRRLWYWKHELVNAHRADAVLTVSDTTRMELLQFGVCASEKLVRVHLAAAPEFRAEPRPDDASVLARHEVRVPFLLSVGGYDPHKNVDLLVRAFETSGLATHQLVVAAEQREATAALRASWARLGCANRLRLIEPLPEELPALYRGAQLLVQPSRWESFAFPLVEAMASGLPILASRCGAMPEVVDDAAVFFAADDVAEAAEQLRRVSADAALRATLRGRGLRRAAAFSWARTAEETVAVYRRVLAA
jgi:glycosyltransferase involved in cell wall biosynthesis